MSYYVATQDGFRGFRSRLMANGYLDRLPLAPGEIALLSRTHRDGSIEILRERARTSSEHQDDKQRLKAANAEDSKDGDSA